MPVFQVVDRDSEEAEVIRKYVKNTHATTHNAYDLEVIDVRVLFPLSTILPGLPGPGPEREPFAFFFFGDRTSILLAVLKLAVCSRLA